MTFLNNPEFPASLSIISARDEFVGAGSSGGVYGEFGWQIGGGASYSFRGWETGHPGILRMTRASGGTGYLHLSWLSGQGVGGFDGLTIETVVRLTSTAAVAVNFGLAAVGALTTAGRKGWVYDSAVSPNWQIVHQSNGGAVNLVDSGVAAVAGWQVLKLTFNGNTTIGTACTSASTIATVSNSTAITVSSADHTINYAITPSSGTKDFDVDAIQINGVSTRF